MGKGKYFSRCNCSVFEVLCPSASLGRVVNLKVHFGFPGAKTLDAIVMVSEKVIGVV